MSKFDLKKETEKAKFVVAKRGISPNLRASVVMNLDVSGSARDLFTSGKIQEVFQRILPIGITFDDNQEIDVFTFADKGNIAHIEPNATTGNYQDYIQKNILDNRSVPKWGGTDYAPVIKENLKALEFYKRSLFGGLGNLQAKSKSGTPAIVYFFTDGENYDQPDTRKILEDCSKAKTEVYFLFIGIGNANFRNIVELGDDYDNVGFLNVKDINGLANDEDFYDKLLPEELTVWLKDYV